MKQKFQQTINIVNLNCAINIFKTLLIFVQIFKKGTWLF